MNRFCTTRLLVVMLSLFTVSLSGVSPIFANEETPVETVQSDEGSHREEPSSWEKVLAGIGLVDDRSLIPPKELSGTPQVTGQDYVIGPGDQLFVSVWRDEALTRTALVLPDGKIQFPLIGEVVAGGKTVAQLKKEIEEKLSGYVVDAGLSVEVRQPNSFFVYIIGKVNAPGRQMLLANTNVLQALAMAGGVNVFADKDDIRVFRQEGDRTRIFTFRYSLVSAGKQLDDNIWLQRGDVIVVP